ncbi:MAG: HNH endonuclease [Myxococcota bacterium]
MVWSRSIFQAHRIAWGLANGADPGDAHVLHRCDNPPCVNPAHLFLGDAAANAQDRHQKGRSAIPVRRGGRWTGRMRRDAS